MDQAAGALSVDHLRTLANDHARAQRWADLLALEPNLRADGEYWTSLWGPACAIAGWHEGRADARDLLEECISSGFHQMANFGKMFDSSFGTEPDWLALRARIEANVPPPPVELVRWPCARPILPMELSRLDLAGEARLAARLPEPPPGAWAKAELLLGWVTNRWRHTSSHHDQSRDANVVLDRVDLGDRFACVEYTVVLTQALNALQVPARRISLHMADYHAGLGTAHAVTEAWIDDLGKWVLLDGQNGAVWRAADGTPLSVLELQRRYLAGDQPEFTGTGHNFDPDDAGAWFGYFHTAAVTDQMAWSAGRYVPIMEGSRVLLCARLADSDADAAPDLAAISTGIADHHGAALVFHADHPYATGFALTGQAGGAITLGPGQPLGLVSSPGEHKMTVAVQTRHGTLAPQPLQYIIR